MRGTGGGGRDESGERDGPDPPQKKKCTEQAEPAERADSARSVVSAVSVHSVAVKARPGTGPSRYIRPMLVSIISPTYNQKMYVGQCIESALAQTYPHWEQIFVDDGSTDGTRE